MDNLASRLGGSSILVTKSSEECLRIFKDTLLSKDETIESLRKQVAELKQENYKDITIQNMQAEINELRARNGFFITDEEQERIDKWIDKHTKKKHKGNKYSGAIGGRYTYLFTPTGIGTFGKIKCSCGEEFDFCDGSDF